MKHKKGMILFLLALTQFMVVMDMSIMNVALPMIKEALNFSDTMLTWVVAAYTLTFGGFLLLGGRTADLYGRRGVLIAGMVGFAATSLLIGFAQNDISLIALRALQGLTSAFMSPAALSILLTTFAEGPERTKALSVWAAVASGGAAAGVFLGGVITQFFGWEWNFYSNVPVALLAAYGIYRYVPAHIKEEKDKHLDIPGAILATGGMMVVVYGLSRAAEIGWGALTWVTLLGGVLLLGAFVLNELKAKHPLMPLSIFTIKNVALGNGIMMMVASGMFAMFFFVSLYIQGTLQYSPAVAGASFLVMPIVLGIVSTSSPRFIAKFGVRKMLMVGLTLMAAGMFWMSTAPVDGVYVINVLPSLLLMATGAGMTFVSVTMAATSGVPAREAGLASGIFNTMQQVGGSFGLAVLSAVSAGVMAMSVQDGNESVQATLDGYQAAFFAAGLFILAGFVLASMIARQKQ